MGARQSTIDLLDVVCSESEKQFLRKIKHLIGRRMIGYRCQQDHVRDSRGVIILYKPDIVLDFSNWVRVVMVASECKNVTPEWFSEVAWQNKVYMVWPEYSRKGFERLYGELWWIDERLMDERNPSLKPFVHLEPRD